MLCLVWNQKELGTQRWKLFAHHWCSYNKISTPTQDHCFHLNEVFANHSDEDKIYPLTTVEIAVAQWFDASLKHLFKCNAVIDQGLEIKLIENTTCVCKDGPLVIPKPLQVRTVKWYHHYLQHPGHTHLEETMNTAMYWKGMRTTIRSLTRSCRSCQVSKKQSWKSTEDCLYNPLGMFMCRPHRSIHSQRQRWLADRIHGSDHDQSRF